MPFVTQMQKENQLVRHYFLNIGEWVIGAEHSRLACDVPNKSYFYFLFTLQLLFDTYHISHRKFTSFFSKIYCNFYLYKHSEMQIKEQWTQGKSMKQSPSAIWYSSYYISPEDDTTTKDANIKLRNIVLFIGHGQYYYYFVNTSPQEIINKHNKTNLLANWD